MQETHCYTEVAHCYLEGACLVCPQPVLMTSLAAIYLSQTLTGRDLAAMQRSGSYTLFDVRSRC